MEIGHLGLDGIQGSRSGLGSVFGDGEASKQKWDSRNEGFKQERFGLYGDECWVSKLAKTNADLSPDSSSLMFENSTFPYFQHMAAAHTKNAGYYYSGGLSSPSGMYLVSGVRGPFTASQWSELEQQALIYKYMKQNEPIPLHLLFPIIKAFESAGLFGYNATAFRPTSWGMGPFHLGYSTSTDPEPGRCRRTDGKKWRCSRDAVTSQKYCEKHMNRGRHRSRKHVEGQNTDNSSSAKLVPPSNNTFDINQYQTNAFVDRAVFNGEKSDHGLQQANWSNDEFGVPSQLSSYSPPPTNLDMGLGVGLKGESHKWSSISYGPLGEALQSGNPREQENIRA